MRRTPSSAPTSPPPAGTEPGRGRRPGAHGGTVVRVGTLSKTLGSLGGFVAASRDVVDLLVNRARPYIFSTAPTPADAAAALAALARPAFRRRRCPDRPPRRPDRPALARPDSSPPDHPSPIIPVVLGSEQAALEASAALLDQGLWVPAIRPPTVPVGTSRLRVTLSAAHSDDDVTRLLDALVRAARPGMPAVARPRVLTGARPRRLVVVVGTGTDVGKTWVAARLLTDLRAAGVTGGGPQAGAVLRPRRRSGGS